MTNYEHLLNCNVRAEIAKRNFEDFVLYINQNYEMQWFHKYLCKKLNDFSLGKIKKLMVFMPPQHGKSELTTRLFPPYQLGKNPNKRIVISSYNATLASRFNLDIQRYIDNEKYNEIFSNTYLNQSNVVASSNSYLRNSDIFEVVNHKGFLKSVGRGGALTGTPVDIGIIDDPLKDRAESQSKVIRDSLWSWYCDVFETRLHNDSQQIIIQTRWDVDDLAGRLLKRDNDWDVVTFEAIKENNYSYDPRKIGEPLWGEKHSKERLENVRKNSPITFDSLYQQNPKPTEGMGLLWTRDIIERYRVHKKPNISRCVVAIDPATTSSKNSDETGIIVVGTDGQFKYILDDLSGRYTPNEWANVAMQALQKWDADYYVAEKNQGGEMVKSVIEQVDDVNYIELVQATKGKYVRAEPVYAEYEKGLIKHVGSFPLLENQLVTFNPNENRNSPDRVDALVWGCTNLIITDDIDVFVT